MTSRNVAGVDVSRETFARLEAFGELVRKWTQKINLIAPGTVGSIWERHIVDSAQVWRHAPIAWKTWADFGSGGGFPGIVLACLAKELAPEGHFVLVESDQRKSTFLRTAARELELSVTVMTSRIEALDPLRADVISARALAPLVDLLGFADQHLAAGGVCLFQKGRQVEEEISAARAHWHFAAALHPSITDPDAQLVEIKEISRA